MLHPSCYSCYHLGDMSLMRKVSDCDYDKRNISFVICGTDIPSIKEHLSSPLVSRSLFVLFLFPIVLSVLWFTASDYPFGIFKLLKLTNKMYYKHLSLVKICRKLPMVKICRQLPLDAILFCPLFELLINDICRQNF
jgi:hypothetical protein